MTGKLPHIKLLSAREIHSAMLMKIAKNRAVKKIAQKMPKYLANGWGASEYYTPGQVKSAMEKTGCNSDFIDCAYAMFCSPEDFSSVSSADFNSLKMDVGNICFNGSSDFNASSFGDGGSFSFGDSGGSGE